MLGWQELGQATGAHSVVWIRSDCLSSDLAAQRLLWFNSQRHHVSFHLEELLAKLAKDMLLLEVKDMTLLIQMMTQKPIELVVQS